jgi:hypothetical protein
MSDKVWITKDEYEGLRNKLATAVEADALNAPWLSYAHILCSDCGIEQGHITHRLEGLKAHIEEVKSRYLGIDKTVELCNEAKQETVERCINIPEKEYRIPADVKSVDSFWSGVIAYRNAIRAEFGVK